MKIDQQPTKVCARCSEQKPIDAFPVRRTSVDGRYYVCRSCSADAKRKHYAENRDRLLAEKRAKYASDPQRYIMAARDRRAKWTADQSERNAASRIAWDRLHRDELIDRRLHYRYGISSEDRARMEMQQGNLCACCGRPPKGGRLVVDHNHHTDVVRELLCVTCNAGLGAFEENPGILRNAIAYLERHGGALAMDATA